MYYQTQPRTLVIKTKSWGGESMVVTDANSGQVLYTTKLSVKKPHVVIQGATTGATVGTADFHAHTSRIDVAIYNHPLTLTSHGMLKPSYSVASPALGNENITWKNEKWSKELDKNAVDSRGNVLARMIENDGWTRKGVGSIELLDPRVQGGYGLDEMVVMALIFFHQAKGSELIQSISG
ncbi:hypothetical protein C1H76_5947 [Elsinoe australis]|uniref:Uncharacterized protein n=1 Tax=Elsinoe australis TaxID=40998 RepID=A0A4U7ATZ9_9PEZI|nr:hypothetical protein C1H76_5947 [Elsinoe australis]